MDITKTGDHPLRRSYQAILATALLCTSLPSLAEHTCPQNNDYLQRDLAKTMIRELVAGMV